MCLNQGVRGGACGIPHHAHVTQDAPLGRDVAAAHVVGAAKMLACRADITIDALAISYIFGGITLVATAHTVDSLEPASLHAQGPKESS